MAPDIRPPKNCVVVDSDALSMIHSEARLLRVLEPHGLCTLCVEYDPANFQDDTLLCVERPCAIRTGCESTLENSTHSVVFLRPSKFAEFRLEHGLSASEYHKPTTP